MTAYLNLIVSFCNKIVAMMSDDSIASILGAPFIYIAFSFFMIWMAANIFLIHPNSLGPLYGADVLKQSQTKSQSLVKTNVYVYNSNQVGQHSNGGYLTSGSNYSYVWTDGGFKEVYDAEFTENN